LHLERHHHRGMVWLKRHLGRRHRRRSRMLRAATTRERLRVITGLFVAVVPCCSGQSRVSSSGVQGCEARGPMCEPGCRLMQISHLNACERDNRGAFVRTDGGFSSPLCRYHVAASTGKVRGHDGVRVAGTVLSTLFDNARGGIAIGRGVTCTSSFRG